MLVKNTFLHWAEPVEKRSGRSQSADAPKRAPEDECAQKLNQLLSEPARRRDVLAPLVPTVAELRGLQWQLGKRILSSSSVSTMASEEESRKMMPKARSSNSVCSMWSDMDDGQISPILEEGPKIASAKDGSKVEFTHNQVPKNVNLAVEFSKKTITSPPTTMMIRNIPNRYTQREFVRELDQLGFAGTYDFMYLPIDKGTLCNVGYAFVNFLEPKDAERSCEVFHNYVFQRYRKARGKIATVSIAHLQGLDANLQHYQHSAVNTAPRIKQRGPLIIPRGAIASNLC